MLAKTGVLNLFHITAHFAQLKIHMTHKKATTGNQISEIFSVLWMAVLERLSYLCKARKEINEI